MIVVPKPVVYWRADPVPLDLLFPISVRVTGLRPVMSLLNCGGSPLFLIRWRPLTLTSVRTMSRYLRCASDEESLNDEYEMEQAQATFSSFDADMPTGAGVASVTGVSSAETPSISDSEPVCVCRCLGTPHGPTCYITRGGVRALVEATAGIFSDRTGRHTCTRAILGALSATALGALGAATYYSLTISETGSSLSSEDAQALADAAEQVSLSDLPVVTPSPEPDSSSEVSVGYQTPRPWFDQYD